MEAAFSRKAVYVANVEEPHFVNGCYLDCRGHYPSIRQLRLALFSGRVFFANKILTRISCVFMGIMYATQRAVICTNMLKDFRLVSASFSAYSR